MVILGGLEIVVGGYLIHRHYKHKNEKKQLQDEEEYRRQQSFPGVKAQYHPAQQPVISQQQKFEYACHTPQPQQQPYAQGRPRPRPRPRPHASQTFPQVRPHPPPQRVPLIQQEIQPLQRADSFATLSNMPVADGLHRHDSLRPPQPPRPQPSPSHTIPRRPVNPNSPYSNAGFSVSTPAFGPVQHVQYTSASAPNSALGRNTVDDNWETYGHQSHSPHVHFAEPAEDRENDPPPPYTP